MKKTLIIIFLLIGIIAAQSQTPPIVYVSGDGSGDYNCDGISDQLEINQALDFVAVNTDYTTVYLKGSNTFEIDEPVLISSNTILTGDSTATIKLKDNVAWWTHDKPMITQTGRVGWDPYGDPGESISNVEIYGFKIDGALLQEEPSGDRYNTLLHFTFPNNVQIHDMYFTNGQSDAIRLSSLGTSHINCVIYDNYIIDCGHDGISFVQVIDFEAYDNKIYKTRTNSGIRATGCNTFLIHNNIIGNSIAKPSSGYAGIQIQNEEFPCDFGEIYENVIYGKNGGIHVGSVESDSNTYPTGTMKNVHVHHNKIYKTKFFDIGGGTVLDGGIVINGFQNTIIEHNVIDGGVTDGIVYRGSAGGGTGYETIVRNNIIINNGGFGISNEETSVNTFISNNNLVYNNGEGNLNNITSTNDINSDPLFGASHSTLNQWHHIVASYDNATETMKIYIDGVEKSSASYPGLFGTIGSNSFELYLGVYRGFAYFFDGKQDEVATWNRALTTSEVSTLYNDGTPVNITGTLTSGLQAYFQMENNWNDSSGNGFNAEDSTASFTTDAINGTYAGLFNGVDAGVQYPNNLSTTDGLTISAWVYRTGLPEDIQTILAKGRESDNDLIWLYFMDESVIFELGNGTDRMDLEAYITNPEDLDYHVKSKFGRFDGSSWIMDTETSPCIDGGQASSDYSNEPTPNGDVVNIGVYGNTTEASKSSNPSSINDYYNVNIYIYPNPTLNKITLPNEFITKDYTIYSVTGELIKKGRINTNEIQISELKSGLYILQIRDYKSDKTKIFKLIKK